MSRYSNRALFLIASMFLPLCCAQGQSAYTINTVAGNGTTGFSGDGGPATSAQLASPSGVAADAAGNLYIADQVNHRVRKVAADGSISTIGGSGGSGFSGDKGSATSAEIANPFGVTVDSSGNVYIADTTSNVIRKVAGGTITTVAGFPPSGAGYSGDGGAATSAQLSLPSCVALDGAGNLYIADSNNNRVRKVASDGTITTVAGNGTQAYSGDGGAATDATLNMPRGIAFDPAGNLYISDTGNQRIRKVATDGTITTVAGNGTAGYSGDGGAATSARLSRPLSVAVDAAGSLYIVDYNNSRIRRVANGVITTIAGNGRFGYTGDGGPATSASLYFPSGIALGPAGVIYFSDTQNNVIRMLTLSAPANSGNRPSIKSVIGAGAFGAFTSAAPGSWIEIYGSDLAAGSRQWAAADFKGAAAPILLDGTSVTIGGQAAFISYISGGQVNAQVPSSVGTGPQQVIVSTASGTSDAYTMTVNPMQPGMLAPPSFNIGGKQYVAALFQDGAYVLPSGAMSGIASRPARPGDAITLYGVGFGPVTPDIPAGQTAGQKNTLTSPLQILFGQAPATLNYWGLAPGSVGLYQFNVTVPNVAAGDAVPLTFTLGGQSGAQTLYIAVQN